MHPLLATAFHTLHFQKFMENRGPLSDSLDVAMKSAQHSVTAKLIHTIESHEDFKELMSRYDEYTKATLRGDHGSTAKFWIMYIQLVEIFLRFSRAYRTNDVDLFIL